MVSLHYKISRIAYASLCIASLAGCQLDSNVNVSTVDGKTVFSVTTNGDRPVCVSGISVDEKNGDALTRRWGLSYTDADANDARKACDSVFTFGQPHKGYTQEFNGKPLESGKTYLVSVGGVGFGDSKMFTVAN
jgi:hypothetical protein